MTTWYLLIGLLLVGTLAFLLANKRRNEEGFSTVFTAENEFTKSQTKYFQDVAGKAVFTNQGINLVPTDINDAFQQPDLYLPIAPDRDYSAYFQEDANQFSDQDFKLCRSAIHPRNLQRAPKAIVGCGWWFVEDPARPSTGALGGVKGPIDSDLGSQFPGGRWVWSLEEAAKLEDIKKCKRVRTCDAMNAEGIKGECGFCDEQGYAVPIDASGNLKYPNAEFGGCGEAVIRSANDCPRRDQTIVSEDEVEFDDNGNPVQTDKKITRVAGLCDVQANGKLSIDCLTNIAKSVGMSDTGVLINLIRKQRDPNSVEAAAIKILLDIAKIVIPAGALSGAIDRDGASNIYSQVVRQMNHSNKKVSEAAKFLAIGNENFDICIFEDQDAGPFPLECLEREFRKAGCQPAGKKAPNSQTQTLYNQMTFGKMKESFKKMFDSMKSPDNQFTNIENCLGILPYKKKPEVCEEPGIEYIVYEKLANGKPGTFVGRIINKQGLLSLSNTWNINGLQLLFNKLSQKDQVYYRVRTQISTRNPTSFYVQGWNPSNTASVSLNGDQISSTLIQRWGTMEDRKWTINVPTGKQNVLEFQHSSPSVIDTSPFLRDNLALFQLKQESWRPVIALDFYKGAIEDANTIVQLSYNASNVYPGTLGGRQCAVVGRGSPISILNGVNTDVIGTLSMMVYQTDADAGNNRNLFFAAGSAGRPSRQLIEIGTPGDKACFFFTVLNSTGQAVANSLPIGKPTYEASFVPVNKVGQWKHYCVVFSAKRNSYKFYIDSVLKMEYAIQTNAVGDATSVLDIVEIANNFVGGIAWCHIYSTQLTQEEVVRDMNYDKAEYVMPIPQQ